ncbi:MAG TPA: hypothetical protein PLB62_14535 [Candidatus Sumerlaeota bacterium]|nr:hypothetical protein [Candidatus Sumerlaeota bacterium]
MTFIASKPRDRDWFAYMKESGEEILLVVINSSGKQVNTVSLPRIYFCRGSAHFSCAWEPSGDILWLAGEPDSGNAVLGRVNIPSGTFETMDMGIKGQILNVSLSPGGDHVVAVIQEEGGTKLGIIRRDGAGEKARIVPINFGEAE